MLLYSGSEKEYKQAKLKAARMFNLHFIPTNLEVALELDRIAEENESPARTKRLIDMRREADRIMKILATYDPLLVGSVWRGTIHHYSDIDIVVHSNESESVIKDLENNGMKPDRTQRVPVTKTGKLKDSLHIYVQSPIKEQVEIIVHEPEEACLTEKCEIYGDPISGLRIPELEKMLSKDPTRRFVPSSPADQIGSP